MSVTVPVAITALPTPPTTADPLNFDTRADAFVLALVTLRNEINAISTVNYDNAVDAAASATSAATQVGLATTQVGLATAQANIATTQASAASNSALLAASYAGAAVWVTGTTYAIGDVRYSTLNQKVYRRITAGAGSTDPSLDSTNWKIINNGASYVKVYGQQNFGGF